MFFKFRKNCQVARQLVGVSGVCDKQNSDKILNWYENFYQNLKIGDYNQKLTFKNLYPLDHSTPRSTEFDLNSDSSLLIKSKKMKNTSILEKNIEHYTSSSLSRKTSNIVKRSHQNQLSYSKKYPFNIKQRRPYPNHSQMHKNSTLSISKDKNLSLLIEQLRRLLLILNSSLMQYSSPINMNASPGPYLFSTQYPVNLSRNSSKNMAKPMFYHNKTCIPNFHNGIERDTSGFNMYKNQFLFPSSYILSNNYQTKAQSESNFFNHNNLRRDDQIGYHFHPLLPYQINSFASPYLPTLHFDNFSERPCMPNLFDPNPSHLCSYLF